MARRLIEFALVAATVAGASGCSPVRWESDYQTGMQKATQSNRRALIMFSSGLNAYCRQMDDEVFADPDVQQLMERFVLIRVDSTMNAGLTKQFGVTVLPSFVVLRPNATVSGTYAGKMELDKFRYFLINRSFD